MKKLFFTFVLLVCMSESTQAQVARNLTFMDNKTDSLDLSLQADVVEISLQVFKYKHLKYLNLSVSDFDILPKEIGRLTNLVYLDLSMSKFTTLPKEMAKLKKLRILDLRQNRLNDGEILKISKMLPKCEILF